MPHLWFPIPHCLWLISKPAYISVHYPTRPKDIWFTTRGNSTSRKQQFIRFCNDIVQPLVTGTARHFISLHPKKLSMPLCYRSPTLRTSVTISQLELIRLSMSIHIRSWKRSHLSHFWCCPIHFWLNLEQKLRRVANTMLDLRRICLTLVLWSFWKGRWNHYTPLLAINTLSDTWVLISIWRSSGISTHTLSEFPSHVILLKLIICHRW